MGSLEEREIREMMGNPGPRSWNYNEQLGRTMAAEEVEVVLDGGLVLPERQPDGSVKVTSVSDEITEATTFLKSIDYSWPH